MKEERTIFADYLAKSDLRLTRQRETILNKFLKIERHLSAEELYDTVKKTSPGIGQASVFRTLKLLCGAGIAREVILGGGCRRYEHKYKHEHHDHLVCIQCGQIIEAVDHKIEKLQKSLCRKSGFIPLSHKMEIYGVCKKCHKKK